MAPGRARRRRRRHRHAPGLRLPLRHRRPPEGSPDLPPRGPRPRHLRGALTRTRPDRGAHRPAPGGVTVVARPRCHRGPRSRRPCGNCHEGMYRRTEVGRRARGTDQPPSPEGSSEGLDSGTWQLGFTHDRLVRRSRANIPHREGARSSRQGDEPAPSSALALGETDQVAFEQLGTPETISETLEGRRERLLGLRYALWPALTFHGTAQPRAALEVGAGGRDVRGLVRNCAWSVTPAARPEECIHPLRNSSAPGNSAASPGSVT